MSQIPHPPSPSAPAVLVVGHGSPREQANAGFIATVERIAARLETLTVLPTFFSIARPSIEDRVAELTAQGVRRIVVMPFFLYRGQHTSKDIPALLETCREKHPGLEFDVLPTLEGEPALEEIVVERLAGHADASPLPQQGQAIQDRSFAIIERQLQHTDIHDPAARAVIRRIVHATADFSFVRSLRIHPEAIARGVAAIRAGMPILCDVHMLEAGITHAAGPVLCAIDDPDVIADAKATGTTRAVAAMNKLAARLDGAIVAIGNAPTALFRIIELVRAGGPRPALVVGLPVGFVGARESKVALSKSDLCYITNLSPRGGSPVAAAALNALAALAKEGT